MRENNIEERTINSLLKEKFFIPSYQRGYRWTDLEVTYLLDDIWDFKVRSKGEYYCLQPIVVKEREGQWEVIDGQQRLTTVLIILNYFNQALYKTPKPVFDIEFETRGKCKDFLTEINDNQNLEDVENIDYYHILKAHKTISKWFTDKAKEDAAVTDEFYPVLIKYTKFIWYQINEYVDSRDIFTRINMGKIPLTNAELIKALFLRRDNFENNDRLIYLKQIEIAGEWDRIEYSLQNPSFWNFLNKDKYELPTRIEFIFDLMSNKNGKNDETYTFRYFSNKFGKEVNDDKIKEVWKDVKDYYLTFEEWYNDNELYHMIGYLITVGEDIKKLKQKSEGKSKDIFKSYLNDKIKKHVDFQLEELEYGKDNKDIINLLLLFNIKTILNNNLAQSRFPFDRYKEEKWSLEHIHAQNSDGLSKSSQWKSWLNDHMESLIKIDKEKYSTIISEIKKKNTSNINQQEFNELFNKVLKKYDFDKINGTMHDITNLTLLDKDSNSALNKSVFDVKRRRIIERDKNNSFIPICTRNVFLKYYSREVDQFYYWSKNDRDEYLKAIKEELKDYLPKQN